MKIYLILLFVVTFMVSAFAQFGSIGAADAKSMGMAKTYLSTSRGIYSAGINPANLVYSKDDHIEFSVVLPLPILSMSTGSDFLTIKEFNYFFGGENGKSRILSASDKERFSDLFKDGGFIFSNVAVNLLGIHYKYNDEIGSFAFTINDFAGNKINLPRALVDVALGGNQLNRTYTLEDTELKGWWVRNYALSYGRELNEIKPDFLDKLAAGVSFKMVHGYYYVGTEYVNSFFKTTDGNVIEGKSDYLGYAAFSPDFAVTYKFQEGAGTGASKRYGPFPTPAGTGFGFDLGFAANYDKFWQFSMAITDIGGINWNKNVAKLTKNASFSIDDITNSDKRKELEETLLEFDNDGEMVSSYKTSLPTAFRMGASYLMTEDEYGVPGNLMLAAEYNQGFNEMPGNSKTPRFSVGADWKPMDWVPFIRTGFSFGGADGFNWAFGLGFDAKIVEFHLATSDMHSLVAPNSAKQISVAFGSRWKI
jgi:hypothetical protein